MYNKILVVFMKSISDYIKEHDPSENDYWKVYNECYIALENSKKINENIQLNEGLLDNVTKVFGKFLPDIKKTPLGKLLNVGNADENKSEYEKALEQAAKDKYKLANDQRKALMERKDKLKAKAVEAKSEMVKNQMTLAHNQMMRALDAQIESFERQKTYWRNNNTILTKDEYNAKMAEYDTAINSLEGKEKTKFQRTRDAMQAALYVKDGETGELRLRTKDEMESFLGKNPALKSELETVCAEAAKKLENLSPEDAKQLAKQYCIETESALQSTWNAQADKAEIEAEEGKLDAVKGILSETVKTQEKRDKFIADLQKNKNAQALDADNPTQLLTSIDSEGADNDDDKKKAFIEALNKKLEENGVSHKIKLEDIAFDTPGKPAFKDDATLKTIQDKIKKRKDGLQSELEGLKTRGKDLGFPENVITDRTEDASKVEFPIPEETAEYAAKAFYSPDEPTREQIEEFTNPSVVDAKIAGKTEELKEKKKKYEEREAARKEASEKVEAQISNTLTDVARRAEDNLDPDFKSKIEDAKNSKDAGTVFNDDGKPGFYDKDSNFVEQPKLDPDDPESVKARKEWEKNKTLALINPSEAQQQAMDKGLNTRIKIEKNSDGNVIYKKQVKNGDSWSDDGIVDRDEAIKIQAAHEQSKIAKTIRNDIQRAYDEGEDYEQLKKNYPILNDISNEEFDNAAEEELDPDTHKDKNEESNGDDEKGEDLDAEEDDETTAKDADGNKLVKGEDGKWYKDKGDGTPDTESGEVSPDDATMSKKKIENPAKKWHRRKKKNGKGVTKNYYSKGKDGEWVVISAKEYKEKLKNYKDKVSTKESISDYLKDKLVVEHFTPKNDISEYLKSYF